MSCPSSLIDPAKDAPGVSSCIRLSARKNVDFPQPEGPMSAVISPGGIVSVTPSRTFRVLNQQLTPFASRVEFPPPTRDGEATRVGRPPTSIGGASGGGDSA